jgi:two-component system chemotaxis response regulator CheY
MVQRVLVVDDSNVIRSHCRIVLERAGYEVIEAWDALQARTVLKTLDIAFLLCDLNLPGMTGLELIEAMRTVPKLATLPAAILTAEHTPELLKRAKAAGVTCWLLKPYKSEELLELVAKYTSSTQ